MSFFGTILLESWFSLLIHQPFDSLVHSEWDLWGPLVICLALAIILSIDVSCFSSVADIPYLITDQNHPLL